MAIVSVGIANLLTLQRVVILWDHRPVRESPTVLSSVSDIGLCRAERASLVWQIILKIMAAGFIISFTAQVMCMVYTLITLLRQYAQTTRGPAS